MQLELLDIEPEYMGPGRVVLRCPQQTQNAGWQFSVVDQEDPAWKGKPVTGKG